MRWTRLSVGRQRAARRPPLSRVAIMEGNGVVMLGKVTQTAEKTKEDKDAKKKK